MSEHLAGIDILLSRLTAPRGTSEKKLSSSFGFLGLCVAVADVEPPAGWVQPLFFFDFWATQRSLPGDNFWGGAVVPLTAP